MGFWIIGVLYVYLNDFFIYEIIFVVIIRVGLRWNVVLVFVFCRNSIFFYDRVFKDREEVEL